MVTVTHLGSIYWVMKMICCFTNDLTRLIPNQCKYSEKTKNVGIIYGDLLTRKTKNGILDKTESDFIKVLILDNRMPIKWF